MIRAIIGLALAVGFIAVAFLVEPFVISEDVPFLGDIRFMPRNPGLALGFVFGFFSIRRLLRGRATPESEST